MDQRQKSSTIQKNMMPDSSLSFFLNLTPFNLKLLINEKILITVDCIIVSNFSMPCPSLGGHTSCWLPGDTPLCERRVFLLYCQAWPYDLQGWCNGTCDICPIQQKLLPPPPPRGWHVLKRCTLSAWVLEWKPHRYTADLQLPCNMDKNYTWSSETLRSRGCLLSRHRLTKADSYRLQF